MSCGPQRRSNLSLRVISRYLPIVDPVPIKLFGHRLAFISGYLHLLGEWCTDPFGHEGDLLFVHERRCVPAALNNLRSGQFISPQHFPCRSRQKQIGIGATEDKDRAVDPFPGCPQTVPVMPRGFETLRETPIIPKHVLTSVIPLHTVFREMTPLLVSEVTKRMQDLSKIGTGVHCARNYRFAELR